MAARNQHTWKNWAGNQASHPEMIAEPCSVEELAQVVSSARAAGSTVKVVGSGHSFTAAAATDSVLVRIGALSGIRKVDRDKCQVTVGAGTTLNELNRLLHAEGLAMPNLGDIAYQTVAGAISTGTHGTGRALPGLAAQVVGMTLVDGAGQVVVADTTNNVEILDAGRVGVGAIGAIAECTLQVVPAFSLRAIEEPMRVDKVLENIDELVQANDHFEFFWIPHTGWALTKRNNRTEDPLAPLPRVRGWFDKTFMENYAYGALCAVGKRLPNLIPRLATALPSSGSREYVDHSYKIFASPRLVKFYEMEHSIPAESLPEALNAIRQMVDRKGYKLNFPVEVRFTASDDIPLSTAYGRQSAYIAVHIYKGMEYEPFFRDVEDILRGYSARPHWGKIHHRNSAELARLYPRWSEFIALRDKLDPMRTFANNYTKQVFGE